MIAKTLGEVCDELSITTLKVERLDIDPYRKVELETYVREQFEKIGEETCRKIYDDLHLANSMIWNLESDIRTLKLEKLFSGDALYIEMGKRAESIRNINGIRVANKNRLNKLAGDYLEIKGDHLSQ